MKIKRLFSRKPKKGGDKTTQNRNHEGEDGSGTAAADDSFQTHTPHEISVQTPSGPAQAKSDVDMDDDVSTLEEPPSSVRPSGVMAWGGRDLAAYRDGSLANTISAAGDCVSISSAGLTLGGFSSAGCTLGADTAGGTSGYPGNPGTVVSMSDDSYWDDGPSLRSLRAEEVLTIRAPPGKLGISLDAPDDGAPFVHSVKDTSPLVGILKVGDRLVAVDDKDVRYLTAIKISKILTKRSDRDRFLTIIRVIES